MQSVSIKGQMLAYLLLAILLFQLANLLLNVSPDGDAGHSELRIEYAALTTPVESSPPLQTLIDNPDYLATRSLEDIPWRLEPQVYWLRATISNPTDTSKALYAHFDNLMLDDLRIYQINETALVSSSQLGWNAAGLSPLERSVPSFAFEVQAHQKTNIYARISTDGIAKTGVYFSTEEKHREHVKSTHLLYGFFVGIMLVIALYNLILFFVIRDKLYLIYIGYILSILMLSGVVIGFGNYIWPEKIIKVFRDNIIALNCIATVFTVLFALFFLKYNEDKDRHFKIGKAYIFVLVLFGTASLFLPEYRAASIFFALLSFGYLLCISLVINRSKTDFQWTKFYVISWLPLLVGSAMQPLELTGTIKSTFYTHYAFSFGVAFEITLMAMALAERMRAQKELALYNATHDLSSNLPNQNFLSDYLQSQTAQEKGGSLCLLKVQRFQTLSAYTSNEKTNAISIHIEQQINRIIESKTEFLTIEKRAKKATKIARLTEDVFVLVATPSLTREELITNLRSVINSVYQTLDVSGFSINLNSRAGVADYNRNDSHSETVIKRALQAVEQAGHLTKDIQFYRERDSINQSQKLSLASDLQHAIRNDELELYHQPQVDLLTRKVVGSEALVRWAHSKHGMVLPEEFIPIAEDMGFINELTIWVLNAACDHLKRLAEIGIQDHKISINISGKDICSPHFLTEVTHIIQRTNTPSQLLTFELTESVMVDNFQDVNRTMKALFDLGINFSIDDYGTGYSSLSYISQMAFTALKIDKSFIQKMNNDAKNYTIVKTTLDMAKALNLKVVAEGIEHVYIEQQLIECDCGIGQGFYYSPPLPLPAYLRWLAQYNEQKSNAKATAI